MFAGEHQGLSSVQSPDELDILNVFTMSPDPKRGLDQWENVLETRYSDLMHLERGVASSTRFELANFRLRPRRGQKES